VQLVARGGMAEVWEGRDEVLNRPVAVKVLLSHLAADPLLRERFRREAVTAARLVHPGIVAIFDAGVEVLTEEGDLPGSSLSGGWSRDETDRLGAAWPEGPSTAYIVMELVPGETLRDLMARAGALPAELTIAVTAQLADALAYAHAQGLVHRDIKPANLLLRDEGGDTVRVKIADFGIAKAVAVAGADLTASGDMLGTPKYLSPEQVQGHESDGRADLYSVGVVLFEMLAGRPPFSASTEIATALAHVQEPVPDINEVRPDLPAGLGELVSSLLVKDPRYRLASALALGGALTSIRKSMGVAGQNDPEAYLNLNMGSGTGRRRGPADDGNGSRTLIDSVRPDLAGPTIVGAAVGEVGAESGITDRFNGSSEAVTGTGAQPTVALRNANGDASPEAGTKGRGRRGAKGRTAVGEEDPSAQGARRRKSWRATNIVVGSLLVAGLLVAGALVSTRGPSHLTSKGGGPAGSVGTGTAPSAMQSSLRVIAVHELTQDGNQPNDDVGQLGNLIDGNPATYWESDVYTGPEFGGSGGFGLVLQLSETHTLHELVAISSMKGWTAEVFTSDHDSSVLAGWGSPLDERSGIDGSATFSLAGRTASWVLFWVIDPGPRRQAVVEELSVH
jgi:serine/threonine protein kinase